MSFIRSDEIDRINERLLILEENMVQNRIDHQELDRISMWIKIHLKKYLKSMNH